MNLSRSSPGILFFNHNIEYGGKRQMKIFK